MGVLLIVAAAAALVLMGGGSSSSTSGPAVEGMFVSADCSTITVTDQLAAQKSAAAVGKAMPPFPNETAWAYTIRALEKLFPQCALRFGEDTNFTDGAQTTKLGQVKAMFDGMKVDEFRKGSGVFGGMQGGAPGNQLLMAIVRGA